MVLWTLSAGGALVAPDDDQRRDPRRIGALVAETSTTHVVCLPTYWRLVLDHCPSEQLATVRIVVIGAEACPRGLARQHDEVLGRRAGLHNEYGPTETTVWCTAHQLGADDERFPVPIGRPVAGSRSYVVDGALRLVAPGMGGDLLIGGPNVSAGYLGRPDLTAASFVADPFVPGQRAYRTGDRVRWLPDGTLQFLGRDDDQLKLRGRRIELGDVEAALTAHPGVHDAAAAVVSGPASPLLTAWVSGSVGPTDVADVVEVAGTHLASWMIPAQVTVVDQLPRTDNGKVDRRALVQGWAPPERAPDPMRPEREPTDTERRLRELWRRMLGQDAIALTDDFFALGGHSLLAVELFASIEAIFGQDLPLSTLLDHPTVAMLAAHLDEHRSPTWSTTIVLDGDHDHPGSDGLPDGAAGRPPLFCVHGAGGNILRLRDLAAHLASVRPFHAIQSHGLDGRALPFARIEDMAAEYLLAVRQVQPRGPHLLGGFSLGGVVAFEMACQSRAGDGVTSTVVLIDSAPPGWPAGRARPRRGPEQAPSRRLARVAIDEARLRVGLRIPVHRRPAYLLRTGRRLFRSYQPSTVYDGPVLLVLPGDDPEVADAWRSFAPRLEVVVVRPQRHEAGRAASRRRHRALRPAARRHLRRHRGGDPRAVGLRRSHVPRPRHRRGRHRGDRSGAARRQPPASRPRPTLPGDRSPAQGRPLPGGGQAPPLVGPTGCTVPPVSGVEGAQVHHVGARRVEDLRQITAARPRRQGPGSGGATARGTGAPKIGSLGPKGDGHVRSAPPGEDDLQGLLVDLDHPLVPAPQQARPTGTPGKAEGTAAHHVADAPLAAQQTTDEDLVHHSRPPIIRLAGGGGRGGLVQQPERHRLPAFARRRVGHPEHLEQPRRRPDPSPRRGDGVLAQLLDERLHDQRPLWRTGGSRGVDLRRQTRSRAWPGRP